MNKSNFGIHIQKRLNRELVVFNFMLTFQKNEAIFRTTIKNVAFGMQITIWHPTEGKWSKYYLNAL